jgi:cell division protein FtsB
VRYKGFVIRKRPCRGTVSRVVALKVKTYSMKQFLGRVVAYMQILLLFVAVASVGVFIGGKGLTQKRKLEDKRSSLQKENEQLVTEIKSLERQVTLLRSDVKTIEKVAKRKLGMARPDETVYVFPRKEVPSVRGYNSEYGLDKDDNYP